MVNQPEASPLPSHPLYLTGISEFNQGDYFASHDSLEELWMECRGETKTAVQGLVQLAVGCFHLAGGNIKGAKNLLQKSAQKLEKYGFLLPEVETKMLVFDIKTLIFELNKIRDGKTEFSIYSLIPQIRFTIIKE